MSQSVPLTATPNQQLSVQIGDSRYDLWIKAARGIMSCTVSLNDTVLLDNVRMCAGTPLIVYERLEDEQGNFVFVTENEELPRYQAFGTTQQLIHLTAEEVASARG